MTLAPELTVQVSAGRSRARLPILRRAVAGASSKAGLPVDRIDDAILILEALLCDGHTARADEVHLVLTARPGRFTLLMGPLVGTEAERLLAHAALPMVGPVIERLATSAVTVDDGSHLLVVVDAA
ncbi:MAG: hypothetical protein QOJ46_1685 [bacterium]